MEHMQFCHFSLRIRAEIWNKCVLIILYCLSNNFSPSLPSQSLSSLSLCLWFGLAVMSGCRVETLRQSNPREITDIFQYCIRIKTRFLRFRIFQPKIKMDSRWFPLLFIHYTNCIKWLSGVDAFSLSSTACSLSLRQGVQTGTGNHRAYPMGTVKSFPGSYPKMPKCINPNKHLCTNNFSTVFTTARHCSCPELLESGSHIHPYLFQNHVSMSKGKNPQVISSLKIVD